MSPSMSPFKLESGPAAPGVRAGRWRHGACGAGGLERARRAGAGRPAAVRPVSARVVHRFGGALRSRTSLYLSLSSFDISYI